MSSVLIEQQAEPLTHFQQLFEARMEHLNVHAEEHLAKWRRLAMKQLTQTPFPTRRNEDWKYTATTRILAPAYQRGQSFELSKEEVKEANIVCLDAYLLVFINGEFSAAHSDIYGLPEGMTLWPLAHALKEDKFRNSIESQLYQEDDQENNAFEYLNMAMGEQGYYIHVPKNMVVEKPVHFLYLNRSEQEDVIVNPQIVIDLERGAELQVIEHYLGRTSAEKTYFTNAANRFHLGENAHLKHYRIQDESTDAFHVNNTRVRQERTSTYSGYLVDLGAQIVRNNLGAILLAESTSTNFYGMYFGRGQQHIDNQTFIDHAFPHCESNELYKGIVNDRANAVFNGKVLVRQDAQKTNAFQQNSSLVLSPKAVVDSKPQLEIFADDVKCSHGATIGQLDENSVFYLRSRGLSDEKARALLQYAFLKEVLDFMPEEKIIHAVEGLISEKFIKTEA